MNDLHKQPAWKIFNQLLDEGIDSELIIAGSSAYAQRVQQTGEIPLPLADWLIIRGWEKHRH
jgi:hypothetical protein